MAKSYFAILGVTSSASADEIRSAYRRLAKAYHPDRYSGRTDSFRQVQEAYTVLGNSGRRAAYERSLTKSQPRKKPSAVTPSQPKPEPLIPEQRPADMGEISPTRSFRTYSTSFDEVFDWLWDNFADLDRPKSGRVERLTMEVPLTKEQAARGGTARVMVPARAVCPTCRGYGSIGFYECVRCAGEGAISGEIPVAVSFPPGLAKDHSVVIPLERFGIRNVHMTVLFRPTDSDVF